MLLLLSTMNIFLVSILISCHTIPTVLKGTPITTTEYPFIVQIKMKLRNRTGFCTGSLIAKNAVLTAAHCLKDYKRKNIVVRLGVNKPGREMEKMKVSKFVVHPKYVGEPELLNDIGIIFLQNEVKNPEFQPISMDFLIVPPVKDAMVIGYGPDGVLKVGGAAIEDCIFYDEQSLCTKLLIEQVT